MKRNVLRRAVELFGSTEGTFNLAGLSGALSEDAGTNGSVDGNLCRAILRDRDDVEPLKGASHFRFHDGVGARSLWWWQSASCQGDCGFRVRVGAHGRESAYCHVCLKDILSSSPR